jgi:hypothetical protein
VPTAPVAPTKARFGFLDMVIVQCLRK